MKLPSLLTAVALLVSQATPALAQTPSSDPFPNKSIVIYVADFDIDSTNGPATSRLSPNRTVVSAPAAAAPPNSSAPPAASASANGAATSDSQVTDETKAATSRTDADAASGSAKPDTTRSDVPPDNTPRAQAARLVDLTSTVLVQVLEKAGYTVKRLRNSVARPESGVVIHGVFAQVDPNAGLRRVVVGGIATDPKMLLFIAVGNLARPEQSLYQVVKAAPAGNIGPEISVSVYAPVSRYELDFDPAPEQLKSTSEIISQDLTRVLNANPLALNQ